MKIRLHLVKTLSNSDKSLISRVQSKAAKLMVIFVIFSNFKAEILTPIFPNFCANFAFEVYKSIYILPFFSTEDILSKKEMFIFNLTHQNQVNFFCKS